MPLATNLSYLGVAKETTPGTAVTPSAFIPYNTFNPVDVIMPLEDKGLRGAMVDVFNYVQGPSYATLDIAGLVYPDTIPWFASGVFGDISESGASAPFSHTHFIHNTAQPGAKTFTDFYGYTGTHTRQFAGGYTSELALKWTAEGMFEYAAKATCLKVGALVAKPTQSFGAIPPFANWVATVTVGGGSILNVMSGEIDIKRNANVIHTTDGTQAPYAVFLGPMSVTGKLSVVMEDDTELLRFLNNTQPSLVVNWTTGAGPALVQVQPTMTKVAYETGAIVRGKDFATTEIGFTAIANTTDIGPSGGYGLCQLLVKNAVAASIYQ